MDVKNLLQTKICELTEEEKVPIIKNWLGRGGLQLIQTFTKYEKEAWKKVEGLFSTLSKKFKPQHNEIALSL